MPELILPEDCLSSSHSAYRAGLIIMSHLICPDNEIKREGIRKVLFASDVLESGIGQFSSQETLLSIMKVLKNSEVTYRDITSGALLDSLVANMITVNHVALLLLKMAYSENVEVSIRQANTIVEKISIQTGKNSVVPNNTTGIKEVWKKYRHLTAYTFSYMRWLENYDEFNPFTPSGLTNFLTLAKEIQNKLYNLPTNKHAPNKPLFNKSSLLLVPEKLNLKSEVIIIAPFLEEEKLYYCQYETDG